MRVEKSSLIRSKLFKTSFPAISRANRVAAVSRAKQILFTESANGQLAQMVLEKLYGLNTPYETLFKMGVGVTGDDIVSKVEGMLCKV